MTMIEDLRNARRDLQEEIISSIKTFEAKTGTTPNSIEIHMVELTKIGDKARRFGIGSVNIGIEI